MGKMDFRYFNQETGKWESAIVGPEEFEALTSQVQSLIPSINLGVDVASRFGKQCKNINDWNTVTENGLYMANNASNSPIIDWCYGIAIVHDSAWQTQIVKSTGVLSGVYDTYIRDKISGVWGVWRKTVEMTDLKTSNIPGPPIGIFPAQTDLTATLNVMHGNMITEVTKLGNGDAAFAPGIMANDYGIWEFILLTNPNIHGSLEYRRASVGYISITTYYDATVDVVYVQAKYDEVMAQGAFAISVYPWFVDYNGGSPIIDVKVASGYTLRIDIGGYYAGAEWENTRAIIRRVV